MSKKSKMVEWTCKNKKMGFMVLVVFFVAMLVLHNFVELYGDDFWYGTYSHLNLFKCVTETANLYLVSNGRLIVNILISIFLYGNVFVWRVVHPILLTLFIYIVAKILSNDNFSFNVSVILGCVFFMMIDVLVSQEAIYWLTGSLNYIIPTFLILLHFYLFNSYVTNKNSFFRKNNLGFLLPLIAIFTTMQVEQSSFVSCGLVILLLGYRFFFKKEKLDMVMILDLFVNIACFLLIVFAPGSLSRLGVEQAQSQSQFTVIAHNLKYFVQLFFTYRPYQIFNIIYLFFLTISLSNKFKKDNKLQKGYLLLSMMAIFAFITIMLKSSIGNQFVFREFVFDSFIKFALVAFAIIVFFGSQVIYCIYTFKEKNPYPSIFLLAGWGVQLMMICVPTMGYRTTLITHCMLWFVLFPIIIDILRIRKKNNDNLFFNATFIFCIAFFTFFYQWWYHVDGYSKNSKILRENEKIMLQHKKENYKGVDKIELMLPETQAYRWMMPYESEGHKRVFREFYNIPVDVEIQYLDKESNVVITF